MTNSEKIEKIKEVVLNDVISNKIDVQLAYWLDYLEKELKFPFEASIQESESFELQWKDVVKVVKIKDFEDMYGILLEIRKGRRKYIFALCDLELIERQSKNRFVIDAFLEWWVEKYV